MFLSNRKQALVELSISLWVCPEWTIPKATFLTISFRDRVISTVQCGGSCPGRQRSPDAGPRRPPAQTTAQAVMYSGENRPRDRGLPRTGLGENQENACYWAAGRSRHAPKVGLPFSKTGSNTFTERLGTQVGRRAGCGRRGKEAVREAAMSGCWAAFGGS